MTRFARIQRNKNSFAKLPEESTSWSEFKSQMRQKVDHNEDKEENENVEDRIKDFNSNRNMDIQSSWCEFETSKNKIKKKKIKKHSNISSNEEVCINETQPANVAVQDGVSKKKKKKRKHEVVEDVDQSENDLDEKQRKSDCSDNKEVVVESVKKSEDVDVTEKVNTIDNEEKKKKKVKMNFMLDGKNEKLAKFDGFYILKKDADKINEIKEKLLKEGRNKMDIEGVIRRHRRNAEKFLSKQKKKLCFHCREGIHNLSECPKLSNENGRPTVSSGICYKCGSTEHNLYQCKLSGNELKFATCFICKEVGHLSKQCPDNPRGLYPQGGSCRLCGDVTHLKRDCPELFKRRKRHSTITVGTINDSVDGLEDDCKNKIVKTFKNQKRVNKIIKFE